VLDGVVVKSLTVDVEQHSWFGGLQAGYDYMLPSRIVIGAMADLSAPSRQSLNGISIGGTSTFISPVLGQESYSERNPRNSAWRGSRRTRCA
jgi:hypothetical protein